MKETWRQQLRQKLADYEQPAPELSWEQIEKAVAANRRTVKPIPLWTRRIAAAAVVLLVVGAGYWAFFAGQTNTDKPKEIAANVTKTETSPSTPETTPSNIEASPSTPEKSTTNPEKSTKKVEKWMAKTEKSMLKTENSTEQIENPTESPENSTKEPENITKEIENSTKHPENSTPQQFNNSTIQHQSPHHPTSPLQGGARGTFTAKLYFSNGMADKGTDTPVDMSTDPSTTGPIGPPSGDEEPPKIYDNIYHRQPIRFGLAVNYRIADRWSIESGLVYTRLTSTYTYQPFDFFFVKADQRLHYIGIPIKVNHRLWAYRQFNVYASLGAMAEKMVGGKRTYDVHFDQPIVEETIEIKPLQFSLSAAVGAEYRLADHFSIYAEPELNYYFKNSSIDIPTFYQDQPLNFGFSLGLRLNF